MKHPFPPLEALLRGETLGVEYKRDLDAKNKQGPASDETIADSLMAIGNADGGYLLLGVENAGNVLGIHPDRSTSPADFRSRVSRKFLNAPPLPPTNTGRTTGASSRSMSRRPNRTPISCIAVRSKFGRFWAASRGRRTSLFPFPNSLSGRRSAASTMTSPRN